MKEYLLFIKYGSLALIGCVVLSFLFLLIFSEGNISAGFGMIILMFALIYLGSVFVFSILLLKSRNPNVFLVIILSLWVLSPLFILGNPEGFLNAILPSISMM